MGTPRRGFQHPSRPETERIDPDESLVNLIEEYAKFLLFSSGCKICGCFVTNWKQHKAFHEELRDVLQNLIDGTPGGIYAPEAQETSNPISLQSKEV